MLPLVDLTLILTASSSLHYVDYIRVLRVAFVRPVGIFNGLRSFPSVLLHDCSRCRCLLAVRWRRVAADSRHQEAD